MKQKIKKILGKRLVLTDNINNITKDEIAVVFEDSKVKLFYKEGEIIKELTGTEDNL